MKNRIFGNEYCYLKTVLEGEFSSSTSGSMTRRLEGLFGEVFDSRYAISFINGTATMHAALESMGIGEGDEVIVPPLTMAATSFAVLQCNATPVFADVNPLTFQISPKCILAKITEKTKAIITVALYGLSPDMDAINEIAKAHSLFVIEDNAECFLGKYKGRLVGTLGDCASYSFQSSKHLTSGEGGMLITSNKNLAEKVRKVQSLGYAGVSAEKGKISKLEIQDPSYFRHETMGWNYRMPELCCAVALAQLENIEALVNVRKRVASILHDASEPYHDWFVPQLVEKDYEHSYWTWAVNLQSKKVSWKNFRDLFVENGGDGFYGAWQLTYMEPMFANKNLLGRENYISAQNLEMYSPGCCPNAEKIQPNLIQFKTNYWDLNHAVKQGEILKKTLKELATKA